MKRSMQLLSFVIISLIAEVVGEDNCVWYGQCEDVDGVILNCADKTPARPLNQSDADILATICPSLINNNGITKTCCDGAQIRNLENSFQLPASILKLCPSCLENFKEYFCQLTCSPHQKNFLFPQKIRRSQTEQDKEVIAEVEYLVATSFVDQLFTCCKEVENALMGNKAMEMMCGQWGYKDCTGKRLMTFLGTPLSEGGFSPFLINTTLWDVDEVAEHDESFHPMNAKMTPCNCSGQVVGEDNCVWYGQCEDIDGVILNCVDKNPARPLNQSDADILAKICPSLINNNGDTRTCCDGAQISALQRSLQLPISILNGCPSCLENFKEFFCQLTCSPHQKNFLFPQKIRRSQTQPDKEVIAEVEYLLANSFVDQLFTCCKEVENALMGNKAMDMMCGSWGYKDCTGKRLMTFQGVPLSAGGFSPFLINTTFWDVDEVVEHAESFRPMNATMSPCNCSGQVATENDCVWYGQCEDVDGVILNCADTSPARPLNESEANLLEILCPNLMNYNDETVKTCCDGAQIRALESSFNLPYSILKRCPSCLENFKEFFCHMTCSPNQKDFLFPQKIRQSMTQPGRQVIAEIEYLVTESLTDRIFNSCREVENALLGNKAMDMMCGSWGYDNCTGQRLLTFLGLPLSHGGFSPFLINTTFWRVDEVKDHDRTFRPLNESFIQC